MPTLGFLIFDSSDQITYFLDVSPSLDEWSQDFYVYASATNSEADIGCTNQYAENYDSDAVINDGSCIFSQSLSFDEGWNMFSFNLSPYVSNQLIDALGPIQEEINWVQQFKTLIFLDQNTQNPRH